MKQTIRADNNWSQYHRRIGQNFVVHWTEYIKQNEQDFQTIEFDQQNIENALKLALNYQQFDEYISSTNHFYKFLDYKEHHLEAKTFLEAAEDILEHSTEEQKALTYLNLGKSWEKLGYYEKAQTKLIKAYSAIEKSSNYQLLGEISRLLGTTNAFLGDLNTSKDFLLKAKNFSRLAKDDKLLGMILLNIGGVSTHLGEYESGKKSFIDGLTYYQDDNKVKAAIFQNLGAIEERRGKLDLAIEYLTQALPLAIETKQLERQSQIYCNIGAININLGNTNEARINLVKGLSLAKIINHRETIAVLLLNLSELEVTENNFQDSKEYLDEALPIAEQLNHKWLLSSVLNGLGNHYLNSLNLEDARLHFQRVVKLIQESESMIPESLAEALFGLSQVQYHDGRFPDAIKYGNESLNLFKDLNHRKHSEVHSWILQISKQK